MSNQFQVLAELTDAVKLERLKPEVVQQIKNVVLDNLGVTIAGNDMKDQKQLAANHQLLGGSGEATIFGSNYRSSGPFAAFVNGSGLVSTELDEGCAYAIGHPGGYALPAIWAAAECGDVNGRTFMEATLLAYEINTRIARAAKLRQTVHPHGTTGTVGAAAGAGYVLGQSKEQLCSTMSISSGMALVSSQAAAMKGATVRNVVTGLSAQNGLYAAYLSSYGYTGEKDGMSVAFGQNIGTEFDQKWLEQGLPDGEFYMMRNYFKMYACSRWNASPVDAALALREQLGDDLKLLERAEIATYDPATRLSWPNPDNVFGCRFSIPYTVSVSLLTGECGLSCFSEEMLRNERLMQLTAASQVVEDKKFTAMIPEIRAARVTVFLKDGRSFSKTVEKARGEWTNPYTVEELQGKFRQISAPIIGEANVSKIIAEVNRLEDVKSIRQLVRSIKK